MAEKPVLSHDIARIHYLGQGCMAIWQGYLAKDNWELDRLAQEVGSRLVELVRERGLAHSLKMWSKDRHLDRMRESAHFRFTREVVLHQIEPGDAARFLEMMRSNALSHQFQFTEQEIGFDRLSLAAGLSV
jgi:hypothetical protein